MSLLPLRGEARPAPNESRVLELTGAKADIAFETLTAATTRTILSIINEHPSTPTELRDEVDTSLQNIHYHLQKLEAGGFIEPAGIGYSEKGIEMTVYAPKYKAIVLVAGPELRSNQLREVFR